MFKKIAVSLDGSALAEKALPFALGLAKRLKAEILLLRVAHLPTLLTDTVEHELDSLEVAESYLKDLKKTITNPALPNSIAETQVETLVVYGETAAELIEITPFEKADLLVMTTHGRTGLGRLVLGSVANKVLRQSKLPVLLIKPNPPKTSPLLEEALTESNYFGGLTNQILVTLDGTAEAEAILAPAIQMAKETSATIHLLEVLWPFIPVDYVGGYYGSSLMLTDNTEQRETEANLYLANIQKRLSQEGLRSTIQVKVGNPAEEIADYAGHLKVGMLGMAVHARNEVGKFFLGSVADELLHKTDLPILMVHTAAPVKELQAVETQEEFVRK